MDEGFSPRHHTQRQPPLALDLEVLAEKLVAHGRPTIARRTLAHPAADLAARVASMPLPALLEGGREFGEAGRFSYLMAEPSLVFEAIGTRWQIVPTDPNKAVFAPESGVDAPLE